MAYDHFRPPEHFGPIGQVLFRLLCAATVVSGMLAFNYFVVPYIKIYVSQPLADWTNQLMDFVFGPKA